MQNCKLNWITNVVFVFNLFGLEKYFSLTKFEVCTVSCRPSLFYLDLWPKRNFNLRGHYSEMITKRYERKLKISSLWFVYLQSVFVDCLFEQTHPEIQAKEGSDVSLRNSKEIVGTCTLNGDLWRRAWSSFWCDDLN